MDVKHQGVNHEDVSHLNVNHLDVNHLDANHLDVNHINHLDEGVEILIACLCTATFATKEEAGPKVGDLKKAGVIKVEFF